MKRVGANRKAVRAMDLQEIYVRGSSAGVLRTGLTTNTLRCAGTWESDLELSSASINILL